MITEDYCSYEVAKLLKEKGFDESSIFEFYIRNEIRYAHNKDGFRLSELDGNFYYPHITHQMAMKWLREDKKILISIFCHIDKGYWFCIQHFIDSPYKFATSESIHRKEEILGKIQYYDTYEEAVEAALKYSLKNLI